LDDKVYDIIDAWCNHEIHSYWQFTENSFII